MGDEEFYIRRLKIGKTKSVRLKMGHYKLSPGFSYDSPMGYSITIELAKKRRRITQPLIIHSDRGSHYIADDTSNHFTI